MHPGLGILRLRHPFTTIDPNIAAGWFAAPCPSVELGCQEICAFCPRNRAVGCSRPWLVGPSVQDECEPEYGRADKSQRRFPLWVKDVAGLVPGGFPCF